MICICLYISYHREADTIWGQTGKYTLAAKDPKQWGLRGSLGAYSLGPYSLGQTIWDLGLHDWGPTAWGPTVSRHLFWSWRTPYLCFT